ncbi:hypothetical protein HanPI659440_Chr02g0088751 [Helianthus annuus]|nr:hypothetical protein HanPI659440_Chr02g0088751 [Helianthus annuus]
MAVHIVKHAMEIIHLLTGTVLHLYSCFCYNTFAVCHVKQEFLLTGQMGLRQNEFFLVPLSSNILKTKGRWDQNTNSPSSFFENEQG